MPKFSGLRWRGEIGADLAQTGSPRMSVQISYMGTKRELAPTVSNILSELPDGPLLDVFAGMGAVAESVSAAREVWVNDIGSFASTVGRALFTSRRGPPPSKKARDDLESDFEKNRGSLRRRFGSSLRLEESYLDSHILEDLTAGNTGLPYVATNRRLEAQRKKLADDAGTFPYRMATITYPGSYFGVRQCIEIDSIRYAIDKAYRQRRVRKDEARWLVIALCQVATRINNSTGQFAQFIKPSKTNIDRIVQKRARSVWEEFIETVDKLAPVGSEFWRSRNRGYRSDASRLLKFLTTRGDRPAIVYADPPYSKAEYSRYYHVLDALVDYSYPEISNDGRYPKKRAPVDFARLRTVNDAMQLIVKRSAEIGATLVLSYPSNGILHRTGADLRELLGTWFSKVTIAHEEVKQHSTFGGPNSDPKVSAVEMIYVARN